MPKGTIELAAAISQLRQQLQDAIDQGEGKKLRFEVENIDLELKCVIRKEGNAKTGAKFWVLSGEAGWKRGSETAHTVKLKLKPKHEDLGLVEVSDEVDELK